jgi:hypothetical protein
MVTREEATDYVGYVVDDAGSGRALNADMHAIVREANEDLLVGDDQTVRFKYASVLVGYQCGFEPMFVAVHSYLDVQVSEEDAEEMAREYLTEIGWWDEPKDADYILQ